MPQRVWGVVFVGVLVCATWRSDASGEGPAASGLRGVLPATVPDDLSGAIAGLPETWSAWGQALSADLAALYEKADVTAAGQRQTIAALRSRLQTIQYALADARYGAITNQLIDLHGEIRKHADVAEAALDTLQAGADAGELRKNLGELLTSLEAYDASHSKADAAAARKAYDAVRKTAPDGGSRMTNALRVHYFNYNMRIVASAPFLNRFVSQRRNEDGPVDDWILGAKVDGSQTTVTDVSLKLVPSASIAKFDIVASGAISSNTQGVTNQATVFTWGNHYFTAQKEIDFDGDQFWTQPARIGVSANNTTTGAQTNMGLFTGIANSIAVRRANAMRGESEAIAASRVQDRVTPEFNVEVDKQFGPGGKATVSFRKDVVAPLKELKLYPDAKQYSTTDNHLLIMTRLMGAGELGGGEVNPALVSGPGASLLLHESVMNNAMDSMNLQGRTITEEQLGAEFRANLTKLLGRPVEIAPPKKADEDAGPKTTLVFDAVDPIRFRVADGVLYLTVKAAFKQEGKPDIPMQIITVPITFAVEKDHVVIDRGAVEVSAVEKPATPAEQITRAGVIKKKIENALPRRELNRGYTMVHEKKQVTVVVRQIRALDGWISIIAD